MPASARPSVDEVRTAIRRALGRGRRSPEDVAQILHVSRSTLERGLHDKGVLFKQLRREVQLSVAVELMTAGTPAGRVAAEVCMTRDHLCVIVREYTGLTPYQIIRAARLAEKVRGWRRYGPPAFGSALYRKQLQEWHAVDMELQNLFGDLGPEHPLTAWAKGLLVAAHRPDFRRQPYRAQIRERREKENTDAAARLQRFAEAWTRSQLSHEQRSPLEIYLADERDADAA